LGSKSVMYFDSCHHCQGLIPADLSACPHCDHAVDHGSSSPGVTDVAKAVTKVAVAGAAAMTLMACYGGGYYGDDDGLGPIPEGKVSPNVACGVTETLAMELSPNGENHTAFVSGTTEFSYDAFSRCTGPTNPTPERIFTLDPGPVRGQAGTLTVLVEADRHTIWTADQCDDFTDQDAVCAGGNDGNRLELEVDSLRETTIAVESLAGGGEFQLQVVFEPGAVP